MAPVKSASLATGQILKGVFSRVTFFMTMSGSHFMIEALLASEERNHHASAVIDQGPYLSFSREKSPSFADLSREKALPFRIET